jgi:hypothetical protein
MNGFPRLRELNHGILNAPNAMPLKDTTSINETPFSMTRRLFHKSYSTSSSALSGDSFIQRQTPAIHNGFMIQGPKTTLQKKWIGGNRDASNVIRNRRIESVGQTTNATGPQSFVNIKDENSRIEALARVRGGGSRVPKKVSHKNITGNYNVFSR